MTKPIRVLEVFHGMDCGGAENMIMNLYRNIDRTKVQFDFLVHTPNKCFFDDEILSLGGNIYSVPYYRGINYRAYSNSVNAFFSGHSEISVVHGHLGSCANIYLNIAKKHGCYTIVHSHSTKPERSLKNALYRLNTYHVRRIADYFIGCSDASGEYRFGKAIIAQKEKYITLNNAINTDAFLYNESTRNAIREKYGIGNDWLIGHVGRFNYPKNHEYLIDVFNHLIKIHPDSKLILVGEGDLREGIAEKVKKLNMSDNVIFTGLQRNVNEILQAVDCFVFPSHYEGLPLTVIEAQAASLPCVISDTITKEVAITDLVKYASIDSDPQEWTKIIANSIENNIRVSRKAEIVKAGYDIDATTKWLTELYVNHSNKRLIQS